jgi:hypothetical protein
VRISLVPAYEPCTQPNGDHQEPPADIGSCLPPMQTSPYVTVGTPDANGAGPNSTGFARYRAKVGEPGLPDDSDILIEYEITDVRCTSTFTATCSSTPNLTGGPDYTGTLGASVSGQITDHQNNDMTPPSGSYNKAGTVQPLQWAQWDELVELVCAETSNANIGATCGVSTSANVVVNNQPKIIDGGRMWAEKLSAIEVEDGGPDGRAYDTRLGNKLFATEGLFIP